MTVSLTEEPHIPPTAHKRLADWVQEVAVLTQPDAIHWVDGSVEEYEQLTDGLVTAGTLVRLNPELFPQSFAAFSDPSDVARVEERTFICTEQRQDAGFTNNWEEPQVMRERLRGLFRGCMRGRTMYVIPFVMGHLEAADPKFGVQITDSAYVVASMSIMTRMGTQVLRALERRQAFFVPALHSVGAPLESGQPDCPWPCNPEKWIVHFPQTREIWSFGSGYGGNALLGKKCFALRIASAMAHDEGWMAEHMLILKLTDPHGRRHYVSAAFPSACGKTNLALLEPTHPGWKAETLGDDIAWMRVHEDGTIRAINPETGLFGVAPGTGWTTNPAAMRAIQRGHTIFTNVALTADGGVWWEGMTPEVPQQLTDWRGQPWTPDSPEPAAHPNARFCTPIEQLDILAPEYEDPEGVPISAIFFGGRRKTTIPLVTQAFSWEQGVFMGACLSSETTAAADGAVGVVRRDPMAMLPFIGYDVGEYLSHWLHMPKNHRGATLPAIFLVNWFRRTSEGGFAWPGFSENWRVLAWALGRVDGTAAAETTPLGWVPKPEALDVEGLELDPSHLREALTFRPQEWERELAAIDEWFSCFGEELPGPLRAELAGLIERVRSLNKTV